MKNFTEFYQSFKILLFTLAFLFGLSLTAQTQTTATALNFDGVSNHVEFPSNSNLELSTNGDNTTPAITKLNDVSGNNNNSSLNGFKLTGATSNFILSDLSTTCASLVPLNVAIEASGNTIFCAGGNVQLRASSGSSNTGGLSYQWSRTVNNVTTSIPNATSNTYTATTSGDYTLTISSNDPNFLPATSNAITVTANNVPNVYNVTFDKKGIVCNDDVSGVKIILGNSQTGSTYQLTVGGAAVGGSSQIGTTGSPLYFLTTTPGNSYSIVASNTADGSCPVTMNGYVNIKSSPAVTTPVIIVNGTTGSNVTVCTGTNVELRPADFGYSNYQWYQNNGQNGAYAPIDGKNVSNITVGTTTASYKLKATNGDGCWSILSDPFGVSVVSPALAPVITTPVSLNLCDGPITLKSPSGDGNNQWFKNGANTGITTQNFVVTDAAAYTLKVGNGNCSSDLSSAVVVSKNAPVATISADNTNSTIKINGSTSCLAGNTFTFSTTTAGTHYNWYFNDGVISSTDGNIQPTHSFTQVKDYTVQLDVTTACGVSSATKVISIKGKPNVPQITGSNTMVAGTNQNLIVTTDATVTSGVWDLGNPATPVISSSSLSGSPLSITALSGVVGTSATANVTYAATNGCGTTTATFPVTVTAPCPAITASFAIPSGALCANTSITFSPSTIANPGTSGTTYTWNIYDGSQPQSNDNGNAITNTFTKAGVYDVKLAVTNSCGATDYVIKKVTITGAPATPVITGTSTIAKGKSAELTATADGADSYTWNVVNPGSSAVLTYGTYPTTNKFTVNANTTGTATVTAVANSATCGSSSAATFSVIVPCDNVSAAFIASGISTATPVCASTNPIYTFTATTTDVPSTYVWSFDDGSAQETTATTTAHAFTKAGTVNVYLKVVNACGNQDQSVKTFTIKDKTAAPQISGNATMVAGSSQTLTGTALSAGTTGAWSLNGSTVTSIDPTNKSMYLVNASNTAGTTTVTYTLHNDCGDVSTDFPIVVTVPCATVKAAFTVSNATVCTNVGTTFDPSNSSGTLTTYKWYIHDGSQPITNTSAAAITGYKFTQAGTYDVKLYVENACGSNDAITKTITVLDVPATPQISGNASMSTIIGSNTQDLTGTDDASYTSHTWALGNPAVLNGTSSTAKLTVTAIAAGTANVTYSVTNTCGTSAIATFPIVITAPCGTVDATFIVTKDALSNQNGCANSTTYTFSPTGTINATAYKWYINDGSAPITNTGATSISNYKFTQAGKYDVKLYVENACGNNAEKTQTITVLDVPATPQISGKAAMVTTAGSNTQTLTGTALTSGISASWSISDASLTGGTNGLATYAVTAQIAGTPTVGYTVTNGCGDSKPAIFPITITTPCVAPSATFTNLTSLGGCVNSAASTLKNVIAPDAGTGATYTWYINDGTQLSGMTMPDHTFTKAGTFDVKLFVQNACGLNSSTTQKVTILDVPATPTISGNAAMLLNDIQTLVGNTNEVNPTYTWSIATQTTPALTQISSSTTSSTFDIGATAVGSGMVSLTVSNTSCGSSLPASIKISVTKLCIKPTAKFTATLPTKFCASNLTGTSNSATFTNTSTTTGGENLTYTWSWGDGTADTKDVNNMTGIPSTQSHSFLKAGTYTVQLYVSNDCGLNDVYATNVTVLDVPATPQAIGGSPTMFIGDNQTLQSYSTTGNWSFTSNSPAVLSSTATSTAVSSYKIKADAAGSSNVRFTVTNTCGSAYVDFPIVVSVPCTKPTAKFTINPPTSGSIYCVNSDVTFNSSATTSTNNRPLTYTWYYNDGTSAEINSSTTHTHSFASAGTYIVKLNVTNDCGLNDEYSLGVIVKDKAATPQQIGGKNAMVIGESQTFTGRANDGTVGNNGTWSIINPGSNPVLSFTNPSSANPFTVTAVGSGPAKVQYVTNDNGCGASDPVYFNIYVSQQPIYVNAYPNPTNGSSTFNVSFIPPATATYFLNVLNLSGTSTNVPQVQITLNGGIYNTVNTLNISSLSIGTTYLLTISNSSGVISKKMFVK